MSKLTCPHCGGSTFVLNRVEGFARLRFTSGQFDDWDIEDFDPRGDWPQEGICEKCGEYCGKHDLIEVPNE